MPNTLTDSYGPPSDSKRFPQSPPVPPTPSESARVFRRSPPRHAFCAIFADFAPAVKPPQIRRSSDRPKSPPETRKSRPRAAKVPDSVHFSCLFGIQKRRKSGPAGTSYFEGSISRYASGAASGPTRPASKLRTFSGAAADGLLDARPAPFWPEIDRKGTVLGTLPATGRVPKGTKSGRSGPKRPPSSCPARAALADPLREGSRGRPAPSPGHLGGPPGTGFGTKTGGFWGANSWYFLLQMMGGCVRKP